MFTSVGKKQMIAAMAIFGAMPLPISSTRIGAFATTGIELISTTIGKNAISTHLRCTNSVGDGDRDEVAENEAADAPRSSSARGWSAGCWHFCTIVTATTSGDGAT